MMAKNYSKTREELNKIIKSTIRDYCDDFDQEELLKSINDFSSGLKNEFSILPNEVSFLDDKTYGYYFLRFEGTNIKAIIEKLKSIKFDVPYRFIIIVDNIETKMKLDKQSLFVLIEPGANLPNQRKNIKLSKMIIQFFNDNNEKNYFISITKRVDSISIPSSKDIEGYVFTAKLYDIVNLYNSMGDSLFDYNVRYRIKDELSVDEKIKTTIKEEPEKFWFYNNGITILINDDDFAINNPRKILLSNIGSKIISVINGAQTISAASEYFFENQDDNRGQENAYVLLRIINISKKSSKELINNISVSLNRQKSISEEDIVFTDSFVDNINSLTFDLNDDRAFEIVKRGALNSNFQNYKITMFAKLVKCFLDQSPGIARNSSKALLKMKISDNQNTYAFTESNVFHNIKDRNDFYKYYSPTNFASSLLNLFDSVSKKHKNLNDVLGDIYKYSSWYFIAKTVLHLNNYQYDYSNFNYSLKKLNEKQKDSLVATFAHEFSMSLRNNKFSEKLDSNTFKKDELYNTNVKNKGSMPKYEKKLDDLFLKKS